MIKMKKKIILLVAIIVVLIGTSSASEVSNNQMDVDSSHFKEKLTLDKTPSNTLIQKSAINDSNKGKIIKKNNENVKTAGKTYTINNFDTMHNVLTSKKYDSLTLNINSNIKLKKDTTLNKAIKTLTINGNKNSISGGGKYQFLTINKDTTVTIKDLTVTDCYTKYDGGAIKNYGNLTIKNSTFKNNFAEGYYENEDWISGNGGAIYSSFARLTIADSTLNDNRAYNGGAIASDYTTFTLTDSILNNNTANGSGGAIKTFFETSTISNAHFKQNTAKESGGAIDKSYDDMTITKSTFTDNTAEVYGGAINSDQGSLVIKNNTLNKNEAFNGGAIVNQGCPLTITESTLLNNRGNFLGGAVYTYDSMSTITKSTLLNNYADIGGGALSCHGSLNITQSILNNNTSNGTGGAIDNVGPLSITRSTLEENSAEDKGGAIYNFESTTTITDSRICNNKAFTGGALYNHKGTSTIKNSTLNNNKATGSGGAVYSRGSQTIINSTLNQNVAFYYGGAIYIPEGTSTITTTTFEENTAKSYGGAIYNYEGDNLKISQNNFIKNTATLGSAIFSGNNVEDDEKNKTYKGNNITIEKNTFTKNKAKTTGKAITNNGTNTTIKNNINDTTSTDASTIFINGKNNQITYNIFDNRKDVKIALTPVKGIIGENITLKATLTNTDNKKINGGNLAFKLNGKTLRSDGRFDSNAPAMKFNVKDGLVTYAIKADLYLRNAKNLTASYSGTSNYYESTSPSVTAQIQKRNAQVTVTSNPTRAKQYETLTFTIKAKDVTKNGKNNILISDNTKVMLKVNGVSLKDNNGKTLYIPLDKNAQATYNYTIPAGTGGITASKAVRNYTVTAIFVGENYYPGAKNTTKFQVARSETYINIIQAKVTKTNILSVKATLKDYKGNKLIGTNKVTIKINGKSYTKNGKPVYWSVKNGNINLTGIQVDPKTTIKRVLLVTGERQAYHEGRAETTNIIKT